MENRAPLFEKKGTLIAIITFIVTFVLFFTYTQEFQWCLIASVLNAVIIWMSYLVLRMCYLASR